MDHFLCGLESTQNAWYNPRPVAGAHEFAIGNSSFQLIPITSTSLTTGIHSTSDASEFCNSNSGSDSNSTNPNSAFKPLHEVKIKSESGPVPDSDRQEPAIALTPLSTNRAHHSHKAKSGERWDTKKVCNICGKVLSRGDKLKNHIRTHTNNFPYHCDSCGQGFLRSEGLRVHTRIHTGERPYVCILCGKAYTRKDKLTRHAIIHTGERPFVCQHCGKSFTRKDKMQRHELIHRVDKPFTCSPCNLEFVRQETLNMHLERKHPERLPYTLMHQQRLNNPNYPHELEISNLIDSKSGIIKVSQSSEKATGNNTPTTTSSVVSNSTNTPPSTSSVSTQCSPVLNHSGSLPNNTPSHYSGMPIPSTTTVAAGASLLSSASLLPPSSSVLNSFSGGLSFSNAPSIPGSSVVTHTT